MNIFNFCEKSGEWSLKNKCANFQTALYCYGSTSNWTVYSVLPAPKHTSLMVNKSLQNDKKHHFVDWLLTATGLLLKLQMETLHICIRLNQCTKCVEVYQKGTLQTFSLPYPVYRSAREAAAGLDWSVSEGQHETWHYHQPLFHFLRAVLCH